MESRGVFRMPLIYIIEDDSLQREFMVSRLKSHGFDVHAMKDAWNAMREIKELGPDAIITDIMHPGITGGDLYLKIREEIGLEIPVIISSGSRLHLAEAKIDPFLSYCPKPVETVHLMERLHYLLRKREAHIASLEAKI